MSKPNRRAVRMAQFQEQFAEQALPPDRLREIDLGDAGSVWVKMPVLLPEEDDFIERLTAATGEEEVCLVILSGHPTLSAEEQLETYQASGGALIDLLTVYAALRAEAQEAVAAFRYKR